MKLKVMDEKHTKLVEKLKKDREIALKKNEEKKGEKEEKLESRRRKEMKISETVEVHEVDLSFNDATTHDTQRETSSDVQTLEHKNQVTSAATSLFQTSKTVCFRKNSKRVSEDYRKSTAYKTSRDKANARNRKYLANMTAEQKAERKKRKREAYQRKKELNLVKGINNLTPTEQRKKRKYWREATARSRIRQKQDEGNASVTSSQIPNQYLATPSNTPKMRGERIRAKSNAQLLREVQEKNKTITELRRKVKTLQKSLQRKKLDSQSHNSKVRAMIRSCVIPQSE